MTPYSTKNEGPTSNGARDLIYTDPGRPMRTRGLHVRTGLVFPSMVRVVQVLGDGVVDVVGDFAAHLDRGVAGESEVHAAEDSRVGDVLCGGGEGGVGPRHARDAGGGDSEGCVFFV